MRKTKRNFRKLAPLTLGLALSLVAVLSLSSRVGAVSVPVNFNQDATNNWISSNGNSVETDNGGDTLANITNSHTVNVFDIDVTSLGCALSDVQSVSVSAVYTRDGSSSYDDGALIVVGNAAANTAWGTISAVQGDANVYVANGVTRGYAGIGGNRAESGSVIGGTWSSGIAPTVLQIFVFSDAGAGSDFTSVSMPTADVTFNSACASSNQNPTISSSSTTTIPSTTALGSTIVSGASLSANDPDGDTLTYSITAGNGEGYFAIDSSTGNITTAQTNIPAGTYTITVQVDDGNGGTATADVTITVTASTPTYYCPLPYDTTELLTPTGDCDNDGIDNQTEGFDPNGDSSPADARDTDGDGIADYVDPDSDNDGLTDAVEGVVDLDNDSKPDYIDPATTPSTTYYCPLPYDTTELLTPTGDCDNDGINNQTEGFDPNGDSSPADARDTDGDGIADYVDPDSDNDGITDKVEGTTDTDGDGKPNYVDADSDNGRYH